jgi:hypothetical protein
MKYLIALLFCFTLAAQTTVNNFTVKTNLIVAGTSPSLTVNTVSDLIGLNADSDRTVNVLGRVSIGDVSVNRFVAENNIGLGSYLDPSKTFKVINNNGFFSIDGTGANSLDITFKNKSSIDRIKIKSNGQMRFIPLASDPAGAEAGDVYYNSTSNKLKCYNGTTWNDLF